MKAEYYVIRKKKTGKYFSNSSYCYWVDFGGAVKFYKSRAIAENVINNKRYGLGEGFEVIKVICEVAE